MPTMDVKLGFHQIAKFNYFPGWHQQSSVSELLMNKAAWDALSDQNKAIIEIALGESVMHTYVESDHAQFAAMAEMRDKHKVQVKRWSDEDLAKLEKAWLEVLAEESAKDPLFKKVADHYLDYRKQFSVWGVSQLGGVTLVAALILGQMSAAMVIDATGALGVAVREVTPTRIAAAILVMAGLVLSRL